jgi:hypothetical protein
VSFLSPYAPTTLEEAEAFLKRAPAATAERPQVIEALNSAVAWMEGPKGANRRLVARTYRDPVTLAACTLAADSRTVTGTGFSAGVKAFDDVVGVGLSPGSRVESIESNTSLTLNLAATATVAGTASLTFGSAPLLENGTGKRMLYVSERPPIAVYGARWVADDGAETAIDVTGARLDPAAGLVILTADYFPRGEGNVEIDCAAGYRQGTATTRGDPEWHDLQRICHRLAQCYFQDWAAALGRVADKSLGSANFRFTDFDPPKDVTEGIVAYRRLW